jgi:hypothetical protein
MTHTRLWRRMIRHFSHIFLVDAETFIGIDRNPVVAGCFEFVAGVRP